MFSKISFVVLVALVGAAQAHNLFAPALGVKGAGARNNVQRPSAANPCGNVNIAQTLDTSTAVAANGDSFTVTSTDFNAGKDGSRAAQTVQVDATGTGKSFVAAQVTKNGNANPTSVGSDQVTVAMPAGTKCTGGKNKNTCLVSLKTAAGFGNCVAVTQGAAAAGGNAAAGAAAAAGGAAAGAAAGNAAAAGGAATGNAAAGAKKGGKKAGKKGGKKAQRNGTLKALEARFMEMVDEILA